MAELTAEAVLAFLSQQVGRGNALKAGEIVECVLGVRSDGGLERQLRALVKGLRRRGFPICADSYRGYWWADGPDELRETCRVLRGRAMSSLGQVQKLLVLGIPMVSGQLRLPVLVASTPLSHRALSGVEGQARPRISIQCEVSEAVYEGMRRWLEGHPQAGFGQLCEAAVARFLIEQGCEDAAVALGAGDAGDVVEGGDEG